MRRLVYILAAVLVLGVSSDALAYPTVDGAWRDYYSSACQTLTDASADCTLCHPGGETSQLNPYGSDLDYAKNVDPTFVLWSATIVYVDAADSDQDGYYNGQEILVDCTFPGDDTDHGTVADTPSSWGQVKALFR